MEAPLAGSVAKFEMTPLALTCFTLSVFHSVYSTLVDVTARPTGFLPVDTKVTGPGTPLSLALSYARVLLSGNQLGLLLLPSGVTCLTPVPLFTIVYTSVPISVPRFVLWKAMLMPAGDHDGLASNATGSLVKLIRFCPVGLIEKISLSVPVSPANAINVLLGAHEGWDSTVVPRLVVSRTTLVPS